MNEKLNTKVPHLPEETTLQQALMANNMDGCDITDYDWDWGIYLGLPEAKSIEDCKDGYDMFCLLLCLNIKTKGIKTDWYTPCGVCAFIEENRKAFDKFLNEENREGYRPCDYRKPLKADEDEGYYDVYMRSMECLIAGNYADKDYYKLVKYLLA